MSADIPPAETSGLASDRRRARHKVVVLVRDGVIPFELGICHQLFGAAEVDGERLYDVVSCARAPGAVPTDTDFSVTVHHGIEALADADTVLIPGSHDPDSTDLTGELPRWLGDALRTIRPGTRIASICTAAFVLAAGGLLDDRPATTHWRSTEQFRRLFPAVRLNPDVLYVDNGDVLTAAGEAAGIDLCLHMIRSDFGAAVANEAARRTVVPPHRDGGQAQYIQRPMPEPKISSTGDARAWALANLDRQLTLAELAKRESMSVRTFTRRFRDEVGISVVQWLTAQRLLRARQLLEETDQSIDRIAADTGFGTATSLRQHLHAALGVSPSAYRATFRHSAEIPADENPMS